ncbi:MAG TPA: zinc ribbon domain-containing protein [Rhodanobacteraceae bacterium]|nr:zinc ribbon domain-containing protein [Rhodanobacteraceae bacterium]
MPIYAFACQACGHHFDRLQKLSDADPTVCPQCGKEAVSRQLTAPSFRLAGSGWYETDFKSKGEKKHNLAGNAAAPADGGAAGAGAKVDTPAAASKPTANTGAASS